MQTLKGLVGFDHVTDPSLSIEVCSLDKVKKKNLFLVYWLIKIQNVVLWMVIPPAPWLCCFG